MPSTHTTMTVHLNEALSDFVSANVGESGTYDNASEYVRDPIRRDKERAENWLSSGSGLNWRTPSRRPNPRTSP